MGIGLAFILVSAMAWVAEQAASWAFAAMGGLYISGTTLGGVLGRLSAGLFTEWLDWRGAILITSLLALVTGVVAHLLLPAEPGPRRVEARGSTAGPDPNRAFRLRMFLVGGFGMATFVGVYNVTTYRVAGEPFGLGPGFTGLIFLTYLSGTLTSAVVGRWVQRWSVARVMLPAAVVAALGIAVTLMDSVVAIVVGLLILSAGFFSMHAVANAAAARYSRRRVRRRRGTRWPTTWGRRWAASCWGSPGTWAGGRSACWARWRCWPSQGPRVLLAGRPQALILGVPEISLRIQSRQCG